jgi:hypothetical protein
VNRDPQFSDLEAAWEKVLREHPDLKPPGPSQPVNPELAARWIEKVAEIRKRLDEDELDRTILSLFLAGWTHQNIAREINRSRGCVTKRIGKINRLIGYPVSKADREDFIAVLRIGLKPDGLQVLASIAGRKSDGEGSQ